MKIIATILCLLLMNSTSYCLNDNAEHIESSTDLILRKADSLMKVSSYDSAIFLYRKTCLLNERTENWDAIFNCNLQIAQCFQIKGNFDSTFFYLNNSKKVLGKVVTPKSNMVCTYYYLMGSTFIKIAKIDSAVYYLKKSIDLFSNEVTDSLQVLVIRTLGNANYSQGKYNDALLLYKEALNKELKRKGSSEIILAAIFQNIGIIYSTFGEYDSAQMYLNKSIDIKEQFLDNNDPQLALGYLNYGRFLYIIGYSDEAISYLSKAENIYISNYGIDYSGLAPIYFNKGSILISQRDFNKALNYHERALELYLNSPLKNSSVIIDITMNMGVIYEQKKEFEKAIYYFKESLAETSNSESKIKSLRSLARCYQYQ